MERLHGSPLANLVTNLYAYVGNDPLDRTDPTGNTGACNKQVYKSPCPSPPAPATGTHIRGVHTGATGVVAQSAASTKSNSRKIIAAGMAAGLATSEIGVGEIILIGIGVYAAIEGPKIAGETGQSSDAPTASPPDPNDDDKDRARQKGERGTANDDAHEQLKDIDRAQRQVRQGRSNQIIDSIKKSEQRSDNALKPHNIDLDSLDDSE